MAVDPVHQLQDRDTEPLHREPAPAPRRGKAAEVDRSFQPVRREPVVFLWPDVHDDRAFPGLARRDRRRRAHSHRHVRDGRRVACFCRGALHGLGHELEVRAFGNDRGEIPDATHRDPVPRHFPILDGAERLEVLDVPLRKENQLAEMLAQKLFGDALPIGARRPR